MQPIVNWSFYKNATAASTEDNMTPFINMTGDVMSVEVRGAATFTLKLQGRTDLLNGGVWEDLAAIKLSDFSVSTEIKQTGIYEIGIEGLQEIRANITSISGGDLTVLGRAVNTGK